MSLAIAIAWGIAGLFVLSDVVRLRRMSDVERREQNRKSRLMAGHWEFYAALLAALLGAVSLAQQQWSVSGVALVLLAIAAPVALRRWKKL